MWQQLQLTIDPPSISTSVQDGDVNQDQTLLTISGAVQHLWHLYSLQIFAFVDYTLYAHGPKVTGFSPVLGT